MEWSLVRSVSNILPAHGERRGKGSGVPPRGEEAQEVRLIGIVIFVVVILIVVIFILIFMIIAIVFIIIIFETGSHHHYHHHFQKEHIVVAGVLPPPSCYPQKKIKIKKLKKKLFLRLQVYFLHLPAIHRPHRPVKGLFHRQVTTVTSSDVSKSFSH